MSLLRPPYADEYEASLPYNTNNPRTRRHSSALSSSHISNAPGPSFPQPTISGRIISVPYGDINVASPASYEFQDFPSPFHAVSRPPPRPVPGIPLRTAPPSGPPHPGPAANHMQHGRTAVSETIDLPRSRGMVINLPDPESLERLKPEELIEDVALRRFHNNLLHDADRFWYAVVPEWAKERLSDKEQARQNAIFGIIASEQHYVSELELWLKYYRDPLRTQTLIMASHVVEPFIRDVFFNVEQIKLRHEVLLQALFETQKKNYHQVYSIMDDIFDAVSSEEFQQLYVDYIANINKALARHHREVEENQLYAAFVSSEAATARHPRIRRLDFDSFARRAERRLGQLKLQVEEVQKKAEASHPDKEGITGIILEMLHRTVMLGQANGQTPAEETALRTFRESLENHPWDLADLGLAQSHRAVKYAGNVTQVYPPSSTPLHMVLLDNYLVFTQSITEDGKKKRMVHKPIPLEIIDAELDTPRLRTRTRMVSMLSRRESFEVTRFSIKRNGKEELQVGARTKTMAEKWIQHIAEVASLRKHHVEDNKLLDTSLLSSLSHSLKNRGDLVAACPFVYNRTAYIAGATTTGIFVGAKTGGQAFHSVLPITGISQIICAPGMRDLVIVHKDVSNKVVLSKILMDGLMSSNRRTSWLAGTQAVAPLSDPNDGDVITACAGVVDDRILVAYVSKHYVRRKLHILAYRVTSNALQRLGEPTTISDSAQDLQLSFVSGMIFISGSSCQVIMQPVHAPNVVSSWPVFDPSYNDNFNLKALCDSSISHFVRAVETGPDKLLLVYNTHGCFVAGSGQPISSHRIHEWAIEPKAATYCDKYIALFSDRKLEIRDGENGQPLEIIDMPNMKLLHSVVSYSSSEVNMTLFATTQPDSNYFNLLGELASTSNVASPH